MKEQKPAEKMTYITFEIVQILLKKEKRKMN